MLASTDTIAPISGPRANVSCEPRLAMPDLGLCNSKIVHPIYNGLRLSVNQRLALRASSSGNVGKIVFVDALELVGLTSMIA